MHLYKKQGRGYIIGLIVTVLLFLVVLTYFYGRISDMSEEVKTGDVEILQEKIEDAIITCYALEGSYPESIEYIEKHYGVVIDHKKYFVDYENDMVNLKPQVTVYRIITNE